MRASTAGGSRLSGTEGSREVSFGADARALTMPVACDSFRTMRPWRPLGARVSRPSWVLVAAAAWGCTGDKPQTPAACQVPHADSAAQSLVAANTSFAVDFNRAAVGAVGAGQNAVLSPYSASATLTMVDVGAAGETATQLRTTLHLPDSGPHRPRLRRGYLPGRHRWVVGGESALDRELALGTERQDVPGAVPLSTLQRVRRPAAAGRLQRQSRRLRERHRPVGLEADSMPKFRRSFSPGTSPARRRSCSSTRSTSTGFETSVRPERTSPQPFTLSDGTLASVPIMSRTVTSSMGSAMLRLAALRRAPLQGPFAGHGLPAPERIPLGRRVQPHVRGLGRPARLTSAPRRQ